MTRSPRVLIAHDYLTQRGGAERVALSLLDAFPGAEIVTTIYAPETTFPEFRDRTVRTLWVDKVPAFRADPRRAMPFLAQAVSSASLPPADVVVASTSGWAHGLPADVPVVAYCHTPARWLWETPDYMAEVPAPLRPLARASFPALRRWDRRAAGRVHTYLANSTLVRDRIRRAYGRDSEVLHPPVAIDPQGALEPVPGVEPGYLLCVSRKRGYKNVDSICDAVEGLPGERLVVVGGLPEREDGLAWSSRLTGVKNLSDAQMRWVYANAAALVGVSREDFGLTPVEAYSFGTPAITLHSHGYLDSGVEGVTCTWIEDGTAEEIRRGIARFRATTFDPAAVRAHAERFSEASFHARIREVVDRVLGGGTGLVDRQVVLPDVAHQQC